jgi:hypothetical protein
MVVIVPLLFVVLEVFEFVELLVFAPLLLVIVLVFVRSYVRAGGCVRTFCGG